MTGELTARLERCYSGVVHDVMRTRGLSDFVLPEEIRPLIPDKCLAGPAFTIDGMAGPGFDPHETLLEWTGLLSRAPAGHIWVSQPNDRVVAHMGELSAETLKDKGVLGAIADGYIRDTNFLLEMGFQAWGRGFSPRDIVGHWKPRAVDTDITIGDVTIAPGDYMIGDRDGLIRIPKAIAPDIVGEAEAAIAAENKVRTAILSGMDPQQAYLKHGKF